MLLVALLCIFDEVETATTAPPDFGLAEFELPTTIRLSTTLPVKQAKESQLLKKIRGCIRQSKLYEVTHVLDVLDH